MKNHCDGIKFSDIDITSSHCKDKLLTISIYLDSESSPFNTYQIVQHGNAFFRPSSSPGILSQSDSSSFTLKFCEDNYLYCSLQPGPGQYGYRAPLASAVSRVTIQTSDYAGCTHDCQVGDIGPGGGTIFYHSVAAFTETGAPCGSNCHTLEWAPSNWNSGSGDPALAWSTSDPFSGIETGYEIGYGFANTTAMLSDVSPAATTVKAYRGGTKSDWFIPSKDELDLMYVSAHANSIGDFEASNYWSSTQRHRPNSWWEDFGTPSIGDWSKDNTLYVRPIRAF